MPRRLADSAVSSAQAGLHKANNVNPGKILSFTNRAYANKYTNDSHLPTDRLQIPVNSGPLISLPCTGTLHRNGKSAMISSQPHPRIQLDMHQNAKARVWLTRVTTTLTYTLCPAQLCTVQRFQHVSQLCGQALPGPAWGKNSAPEVGSRSQKNPQASLAQRWNLGRRWESPLGGEICFHVRSWPALERKGPLCAVSSVSKQGGFA